jgi:hypothetical protein
LRPLGLVLLSKHLRIDAKHDEGPAGREHVAMDVEHIPATCVFHENLPPGLVDEAHEFVPVDHMQKDQADGDARKTDEDREGQHHDPVIGGKPLGHGGQGVPPRTNLTGVTTGRTVNNSEFRLAARRSSGRSWIRTTCGWLGWTKPSFHTALR